MLLEVEIEPLAQALAERAMEIIAKHKFNPPSDPLLSTKAVADRLNIGETKVRELVAGGYLKKAPGMTDIRIRQSVVDAYGKPSAK